MAEWSHWSSMFSQGSEEGAKKMLLVMRLSCERGGRKWGSGSGV